MLNGIGNKIAVSAPSETIAGAPGALLPHDQFQKDAKEASTDARLGETLSRMQTQYGAGPVKPREIKKTLGKDDFLRIMITQMKHQDPTQPFKAEQFASELAQYPTVEQLQNMNLSLGRMANQNQPAERLAMTNLIGKTVTVDRERFPHSEGKSDVLNFVIPANASQVHAFVLSEEGETVFEKDLGPLRAGANELTWDGLKSNSLPAKTGNYLLRVQAIGEQGQNLAVNSQTRASVVGVSFEGAEPVFLVGNPARPDKVLLKNISRIENEGSLIPGAKPLAPEVSPYQGTLPNQEALPSRETPSSINKSNFFTFQKGVGSQNISPEKTSPEMAQALAKYQKSTETEAKGFPHGLNDLDESQEQTQTKTQTQDGKEVRNYE